MLAASLEIIIKCNGDAMSRAAYYYPQSSCCFLHHTFLFFFIHCLLSAFSMHLLQHQCSYCLQLSHNIRKTLPTSHRKSNRSHTSQFKGINLLAISKRCRRQPDHIAINDQLVIMCIMHHIILSRYQLRDSATVDHHISAAD